MTKSLTRPLAHLKLSPLALLSLLPWLVLLAWLSSVAWFLTDDAFISFRYTRNLLEGHGLVFNPGERVEGYTNFLWILELAAIWGLFGIRPEHAAPWLSVAYTVATIAAILWWVARLPSLQYRGLTSWMTLGLLCSSATFAAWTSGGGLETRQFTFFIVATVVCLSLYPNNTRGLLAASFCLAAAELTRPEGLLLAVCCFAWFALQRLLAEKRVNTTLLLQILYLVAPFALLVAAHFLFRYAYYGEWLPNSYYAKHIRPWYESGFRYLVAAAIETGLYLLLPLAYVALRTRWQNHRDCIYALSLLCVVAHAAYLLPIGGDYFEYRPLDFYWPLLALPAAEGIAILGSSLATRLKGPSRAPRWLTSGAPFATVLFLLALFYANTIQGALLLSRGIPREDIAGWLLNAPGMPMLVAISYDLRWLASQNWVADPISVHRNYTAHQVPTWKPYEQMERELIPDDALMTDTGIGRFYFLPDLKILDQDGLTDATVARTPVTHANADRIIAHDRKPTLEYLKQRGVNIEVRAPASSADAALKRADYAVKVGPDLWMPFNAVNAQWATVRFADRDLRARNTFSTSLPDHNRFLVGSHTFVGQQVLAHFENGFDGWQLSGQALTNFNQHDNYPGQGLVWNRADSGFLTSYHPSKGNRVTGEAISPTFTASNNQYLAFLIAGGNLHGVGLRLLANGEEAAVWRGKNSERFELTVHPLGYVTGKTLQLQLFDYELGPNGHIMLDHIMLVTCEVCPPEPPALAQFLNQETPDNGTVYLFPGFQNYRSVRLHLVSQGIAPAHVIPMDATDLARTVETELSKSSEADSIELVEWKSESPWISDDAEPLAFLLTKYGRYLDTDDYDDFRVYSYTDLSFDRPWILYEQLEPLTIEYDGGISLTGLALGHDVEQLSFGQPLNLGPERSFWGVMQWRTEPGLDTDLVISLRLYNSDGERAFQEDAVLWNPDHWPTSYWSANSPVETMILLHLPPDLPPGDYELRMVVYDFETQLPTVQIDVWEPETTLARLRLAERR